MKNYNAIYKKLIELQNSELNKDYFIPGYWIGQEGTQKTKMIDFFINQFNEIIETKKENTLNQSIVYNMLLRFTAAFPHKNGKSFSNTKINYNESGSILKAIALLPYIHSLGCNTLYLLPITQIGKDGKKGNLGSPYSIQNHYKIDEELNEPFLEIPLEIQFKALVEACKYLGIKIILEFVFRTSSIDSDMALIHPDWFYWIKYSEGINEPFKPANFENNDIKTIEAKIQNSDFKDLIAPDIEFKNKFVDTPIKVNKKGNKIFGEQKDGSLSVIPSAFADWPPNDNQPLWSDVTYLKMHKNKDFNYIAYNTIRMYDDELSDKFANKELWKYLINVIPFYQKEYNIDGVMIDMGHALPKTLREKIISKAREKCKDFILWEENFSVSEESVNNGYNGSLGYFCFDADKNKKVKEIIQMLSEKRAPIEFFLTPETHNTHRAVNYNGSIEFSKLNTLLIAFLPGIHFIHSGFELGCSKPINTGLGFSSDELEIINQNELALFSKNFINSKIDYSLLNLVKKISNFKIENNIDLSFKSDFQINLKKSLDKIVEYDLIINNDFYTSVLNYSNLEINYYTGDKELVITTNDNNSIYEKYININSFSGVLIK